MAISWPSVLRPGDWAYEPRNAVKSGGITSKGREQRVIGDAGFWEVKLTVPVNTQAKVRAWRAMMAQLRQGMEIDVPVFDRNRPPGGLGTNAAGFVTSDHTLRATTLAMTVSGIGVEDGTYFGIGSRSYLVTKVNSGTPVVTNAVSTDLSVWDDEQLWSDGTPEAATAMSVDIFPPLRAAAATSAALLFDNIVVRCVLDGMDDGDLMLDLGRYAKPQITFRESI